MGLQKENGTSVPVFEQLRGFTTWQEPHPRFGGFNLLRMAVDVVWIFEMEPDFYGRIRAP